MKQVNSLIASIFLIIMISSLYAGATIGTVYGKGIYLGKIKSCK